MKLRFVINQAAAFRRGIDCPEAVVHIEVNPKDLSQCDRDLIANRMDGTDVLQLLVEDDGSRRHIGRVNLENERSSITDLIWSGLIIAEGPCLEDLLKAIHANEEDIQKSRAEIHEDTTPTEKGKRRRSK